MSFTPEVTKMWSKDSFDISSENGIKSQVAITNGYMITAPADYTELQIGLLPGVPARDSLFPGMASVFARDFNYTRVSPILWHATVVFKGEFGPLGVDDPATATPPVIEYEDQETVEEIDEDVDGNPIVTANDEPIEGVTNDVSDLVLMVERNFRYFDKPTALAYKRSVNSDTFDGFAPGLARLRRFSAKQMWDENSNGYWKVKAKIAFREPYNTTPEKAWWARVRHEGFYERIRVEGPADSDGVLPSIVVEAVDKHKQRVTRPVLLNEQGYRETNPENAYWKEFRRQTPLPYNALGLLDG